MQPIICMIKKYLLIFCLFVLYVNISFTQPLNRVDSGKVSIYLKKLDTVVQNNNYRETARFLNEIAFVYWNNNRTNQAINYYEKALAANVKIENDAGIAMINNNLGMLYNDLQQYDRSISYFNKTLGSRKIKKEPVGIISTLLNISVVQNNLKRYDAAISNLQEALSMAREMQDTKQMASCYAMLSETYEKKGDIKESQKYFALYKDFHDDLEKKKIKEVSFELEKEALQKKLAVAETQTKELELQKKALETVAIQGKLNVAASLNENLYSSLSRKEIEVRLAQAQQKQKEIENENIKNKNIAIEKEKNNIRNIAIVVVFACIIIAIIFYTTNKKIKQQNVALNEANKTLEIQKQLLSESNDVKNKIFSIIAHDLRSPLASFNGFFSIIDYFNLPDNVKAIFEKMNTEVTNTSAVLDNLLLWAKTQMEKAEPVVVSIELNEVIARTVSLLQPIALKKNITIANKIPANFLVTTDANLVEIVIRNILQNAIKFTRTDGLIEMFTSSDELYKIIHIKDNGVGMSSTKAANLFSLKNNTSSRGTANEAGTGLGMVLSNEFITACCGKIQIQSEEGKGTTLSVFLLK